MGLFDKFKNNKILFSGWYRFYSLLKGKIIMKFRRDNIKFNPNENYNEVLFWDLYRIYIESKLGYYNIKPKLLKKIKKWLKTPPGTDKEFDIDGEAPFSIYFHDAIYLIKKHGKNLILIGPSYISFNNCELIFKNSTGTVLNNKKNHEINNVEGYDYYAIKRKDCNKIECLLITHHPDAFEIIIETESIDMIGSVHDSFITELLNKGWKYEKRDLKVCDEEVAKFNKYFQFMYDLGVWDTFVIGMNKFEGKNSLILTDLDIIKLNLDKEYDFNNYLPLLKSKNDNIYYILDKKTGKVLKRINKEEKIVADSIWDFKLKIIKNEIEI